MIEDFTSYRRQYLQMQSNETLYIVCFRWESNSGRQCGTIDSSVKSNSQESINETKDAGLLIHAAMDV